MRTTGGKKARIGVIGAGRMAELGYLPWIKEHPDAELAGVADINKPLVETVAKRYGCRAFYSADELIEKSGADAVCVTTPPWRHEADTVGAASRGMHVLCEKPMAPSVEECERMVSVSEENEVYLQIGYCLRFDPGFEKIKCMLAENELGDVFQLRAVYNIWAPDVNTPAFKGVRDVVDKLNILPKDFGLWRMEDTRTGGGVYNDHALHYVDMFRWLMDDEFSHVMGVSSHVIPGRPNEDHASSFLRFRSGTPAYIESSLAVLSKRLSDAEGLINGTKADVRFLMDEKWYILGIPYMYNVHAKVSKYDGGLSFLLNKWMPVPVSFGKNFVKSKRQIDWFIGRIRGAGKPHPVFGKRWAAEGMDGLAGIKINQAVYKSSEENTSIRVD